MAWRRLTALALAGTVLWLAVALQAPARSSATFTVIDRTLVCKTMLDPWRISEISVSASPRRPSSQGDRWNASAGAFLWTGDRPSALLLAISTGVGAGDAFAGQAGVWINSGRCQRVRTKTPLSRRGLDGPPVYFGEANCRGVGRQILVRVRAKFAGPTRWIRDDYRTPNDPAERGMKAKGLIDEAYLAVRTYRTRRPLAFAALDAKAGRDPARESRFYSSARCE